MAAAQKFHAFTQKHNGLAKQIITEVRLSVPFDPSTSTESPTLYTTRALWDTGATGSVITQATAKSLSLISSGKRLVSHAGGQSQHDTYVVNFYLPNQVGITGVQVSECPDSVGPFGAIIGMDIILGGDLCISNPKGETWVTFRYPSARGTDYVEEYNRSHPKVGRNDPCPCNSGKKYKKCHGAVVN